MTSSNATAERANPVYDVAVLGGGPAGATAARALALRGRSVALLEATAYDTQRFGETLPPEINPVLRRCGVWDAFRASHPLESPGIVSVWGSPRAAETDFVANRHGSGWHVDRNVFDALLSAAAADAGATVLTPVRVTRCTAHDDGWQLETTRGMMRARFAIDASGRNGTRLDVADGRDVDDAVVAIFVRLSHAPPGARDRRTLVEAVPDGWWYHAPLPSGESVAVFLIDPEHYAREGIVLGEQLAHAPLTSARIGAARIVGQHVVHAPSSVRVRAAGTRWAAAGDAAAAYDPISGFGLVKALDGALDVAAATDAALDGDTTALDAYANGVRRAFDAYAVQRRAYYARETRWPERPFWRRRQVPAPVFR